MTWINFRRTVLTLVVTWVSWQVTGQAADKQTINTRLVAPWAPTSGLSEAAEYLGDLNPALYWKFMDALLDKLEQFPAPTSAKGERDLASVVAYSFISSSKLRMMNWALSARAYSPKVLSLQMLASDVPPTKCQDAFVRIGRKVYCSVAEIEAALGQIGQDDDERLLGSPIVIDEDHKYPSLVWTQEHPKIAILYADFTSSRTREFHQLLKKWSDRIGYIFRPYQSKASEDKLILAGYGIELQFKSTEYKAQDDSTAGSEGEVGGFLFEKLQELHPEKSESLVKFQNHLATQKGSKSEFEALKAWQVQELGLQASYYTTEKENLLEALKDVSGNFPSRAASLSSLRLPSEFKRAVSHNQRLLASNFNLDEGEGAFFLQGSYIDPDALDLFSFMQSIQGELEFMELLRSLRQDTPQVTRTEVDRILSLGTKSQAEPELALDMRDSSIFWINDLEKDEEYEDWPDDLTQLFFRMGGIMLRPVRRNVFNLVLSVDPLDASTTGPLLKMAHSFMAHKSPVRIGVVFCSSVDKDDSNDNSDKSSLIRRVMNYAVTEGKARTAFHDIVNAFVAGDFSKVESKWGKLAGDELDFGADLACDFVKRSGRQTPGAFLNGVPLKWDSVDDFEEVVLNQLLREAQTVQIEAYNGKVNEDTDIFEHLMNKPHVLTRLNDKILDIGNSKIFSFGTESWTELGKQFKDPLANIANSITYLQPSGKKTLPVSVTLWVFADLEKEEGKLFLRDAIEFLDESATYTRLTFIPSSDTLSELTRDVLDAINNKDLKAVKTIINAPDYLNKGEHTENVLGKELMKHLGLANGDRGVLVNGRLIGPLSSSDAFQLGDWALVQKFSYDSCPKYLEDEDWSPDSIMRVCSALSSPTFKKSSQKRFTLPAFQSPYAVGKQKPDSDGGAGEDPFYVDLTAVVDPASRYAHKMAVLLSSVEETVGEWVRSRVIFNPPSKHSELPLKSYFRYIGGTVAEETVSFENMPRDPLFTQNIFAPDNWMVEVVKCEKDLDNIRLKDLGSESVESVYELEHLLVEGHCLETKTGSPPRGLQFTLTPQDHSVKTAETIVMANLGYFQLKASPGLWSLNLREGPSRDIFALEQGKEQQVAVNSFQSIVKKVKVKRNPGKETASLLDSEEESASWFGFGSKNKEAEEETINVFSVASGHLYERLLRIMMLSVIKNTQSKVKFWFLKNYLSPTLKDILPEMAKEYGVEYELVQYHWPRWLNPQREKQRIIWGYKILFLDVLFPLSLKKIVFVDADQVVRADLKELFDLDLEGNPYGYTPFCDSRTEMEGFRFWKNGYWKSHLGRRKYHISALYVIDLVRFRRIAAGDRLRGQYQALSQDPNSLSNLDQDLPNNMIHQVGIKSLPQEWLWCETWCDDSSKKNAKTIDLCNNPQTKEPKLDAAQRIVPEWKDYDQEIRKLQQRLKEEKLAEKKENSDHHVEL